MKTNSINAENEKYAGLGKALLVWIVLGIALNGTSVQASDQVWKNSGTTSTNWSDTTNWTSGVVPGSADGAMFKTAVGTAGTSANPIIIDGASQSITTIKFDTAAGSYTIGTTSGNALYLTSGGMIVMYATLASTDVVETINAPLVLQGAGYTITNNAASGNGAGSGTLKIGGQISGGSAVATTLTLRGSNTNANLVSGNIVNGSATALAVTKTDAGTWILSGNNTYTGKTSVSSGTLQFAKRVSLYGANTLSWTSDNFVVASGATAAFNVGGTSEFTSGDLDALKALSSLRAGSTLGLDTTNASGGTFTYSSSITNSINLLKLGSNTLVLSGANTYTGSTTIRAGTLLVANTSGSGTGTGGVTVNAGATLGGTGTLSGATTVDGTLNAGTSSSTGQLHFNANLTLDSTAVSIFDITSTGFDSIAVGAALTYGGTLQLNFGSYIPTLNSQFDLYDFVSESGDFTSISFSNSQIKGTFDEATGILTITSVPEPGSMALAFGGLGLLGAKLFWRRRGSC